MINKKQCFAAAQCPRRNVEEARAVGRPCQESCDPEESSCLQGKSCVCDNECGYSCVFLGEIE